MAKIEKLAKSRYYELFNLERNHLCRDDKMIFKAVKRFISISFKVSIVNVAELVTLITRCKYYQLYLISFHNSCKLKHGLY